jgi:hypothetical protein
MKENRNIYGAEKVAEKVEVFCVVEMRWLQTERRVEIQTQAVVR